LLAGTAGADVSRAPSAARQHGIAELRADLHIRLSVHDIDAGIPLLARTVAPLDPSWNPANPRWASVCDRIASDLHADLAVGVAREQHALDGLWERALDQSVSDRQLAELLDFYRSPSGQHYIEFQLRLDAISQAAAAAAIGAIGAINAVPAPPPSGAAAVSSTLAAARSRTLGLSFNRLRANAGAQQGAAVSSLEQAIMASQGGALDALAHRYANDLARFEYFNRSEELASVLRAGQLVAVQWAQASERSAVHATLARSPQQHATQWRAVYAGPKPLP
jgi:hypothetical protein